MKTPLPKVLPLPSAEELAKKFSELLNRHLEPADTHDIVVRHCGEQNRSACYSHDFCDANMVMAEAAFEAFGILDPGAADEDAKLWNAAWDIAKKNDFRIWTRLNGKAPMLELPQNEAEAASRILPLLDMSEEALRAVPPPDFKRAWTSIAFLYLGLRADNATEPNSGSGS
ncbi:MAG: hypothetical protein ABSD20_02980 [Terriglobales bacterium]|jgi:hypothetical protein